MPHQVHQIGRIRSVENRERRLQANSMRVLSQNPSADRMKCTRPWQINVSGAETGSSYPFHAAGHVDGSSSRKGQQQDAVRINAVNDQVSDPVREGLGLARTRASNHKQGFCIDGGAVVTPCLMAWRCSRLRSLR